MVAVILVYLAASIVPSIFSSEEISVEPAEAIVYDESLFVKGIVLRDESIVTASGDPASVDYKFSNGDRVSTGDIVATYSTVATPTDDRMAVESIDRQIQLLNECLSATTQYDLKTIDARTKDAIGEYLNVSREGDLSASLDASVQVVSCFIKRDIKATGDKSYYKQIRSNCESSRTAILNGHSSQQTVVKASQAGYFSSQFDGYETLKASDFSAATPDDVRTLLAQSAKARPSDYIGKLQHFSYWTYLCTVPSEAAERFKIDSSWTLRFETAAYGPQTVTMTVDSVSAPSKGEVCIAFECSFFDEALYSLRICDAQIILQSYTGFRIDKDAVRVSEGETGVYVLSGAKLVFKPVVVLFRSEERDFAVVAPNTQTSSRTLILNDSVVIGGKEVYDGKVVNIN